MERGRLGRSARRTREGLGALCAGFAFLLALHTGPALAEADPVDGTNDAAKRYDASGLYLWLGAGTGLQQAWVDPRPASLPWPPEESSSTTGFNGSFGGGWRYVGGELRIEYLPGFRVGQPYFPIPGGLEYSMLVGTANVRVGFPIGRFQPYVVGGFGFSRVNDRYFRRSDSWDMAVRGGGGINVWFTEQIALDVDVTYVYTGPYENRERDYLSVGYGLIFKY